MNLQVAPFFRAIYARITLNRTNIFFFVFSLLYCLTQGILQSLIYTADHDLRTLVVGITRPAINVGNTSFITGSPGNGGAPGTLRLQNCDDVPHGMVGAIPQPVFPCMTVFRSEIDTSGGSNQSPFTATRKFNFDAPLEVFKIQSIEGADEADGVLLRSMADRSRSLSLSMQCVHTLQYLGQSLGDSVREDLVLIAIQFWLFAISVIAVVNDSVPHLITALAARVLITGGSSFCLYRLVRDRAMYTEMLVNPGTPCALDIYASFATRRLAFQITDLVISITGICVFLYLSLKLLKAYNSLAFRCVGAPAHINRINKFFLALMSILQMEVFVLTTSMAMWADVLLNTAIGTITPLLKLYTVVFIVTLVVVLPWITMGWFATKREKGWMMPAFLLIGFTILVGWLVMFYSIVYRWTFLQWPFIGAFTVASHLLLIASIVLGIVCRLNFGKGHAEYLQAEEALSKLNFTREVFPTNPDPNAEAFDLAPVPTSKSRKGSLSFSLSKGSSFGSVDSEKQPQNLSIYYVQTLEIDRGVREDRDYDEEERDVGKVVMPMPPLQPLRYEVQQQQQQPTRGHLEFSQQAQRNNGQGGPFRGGKF